MPPSKRNSDARTPPAPVVPRALESDVGSGLSTDRLAGARRRSSPSSGMNNPECSSSGLLRKEVIQPHLPVRLPCYDFTPIANPTFDGSPPKGLGHRLRVLPTFVV